MQTTSLDIAVFLLTKTLAWIGPKSGACVFTVVIACPHALMLTHFQDVALCSDGSSAIFIIVGTKA